MSKLLSQPHRHFQKNNSVNDHQCVQDTKSSESQRQQQCNRRGLTIYKYFVSVLSTTLVLTAIYANSTKLLRLSEEIQCGHMTSTIRIFDKVEMHTEIEKSCEYFNGGFENNQKGN